MEKKIPLFGQIHGKPSFLWFSYLFFKTRFSMFLSCVLYFPCFCHVFCMLFQCFKWIFNVLRGFSINFFHVFNGFSRVPWDYSLIRTI